MIVHCFQQPRDDICGFLDSILSPFLVDVSFQCKRGVYGLSLHTSFLCSICSTVYLLNISYGPLRPGMQASRCINHGTAPKSPISSI